MPEEKDTKNPVQSAARIFQVLELLAEKGEMGLMELSTALDLHKSTVHRLLMSLIYMGYARQDETTQKYMLSYKIVTLAGKVLERTNVLQIVKPYMEHLSDISGETVHLVQREGSNILYLYKIEAKVGTIRMASHVGMMQPMYCTGVGKAILSELPEEEVEKIWNGSQVIQFTPKTLTTLEALREDLVRARERGYAIDDEEHDLGVRCMAAPVRNWKGDPVGAISISGPAARMTDDTMAQLVTPLQETAGAISQLMGWHT